MTQSHRKLTYLFQAMDLGSIILMAYDEQSSKSEGEDNMYDSLLFRNGTRIT